MCSLKFLAWPTIYIEKNVPYFNMSLKISVVLYTCTEVDIFKATYFTYSVVCFVTWATVDCYIYIFCVFANACLNDRTFVFAAEMSKLF